MTLWIALFRGINVGGNHLLPMAELRKLLQDLGFQNPQTYIQSGNAVFLGPREKAEKLEQKITDAVDNQFGFAPKVLAIEKATLDNVIQHNPFIGTITEHKNMHVAFLTKKPEAPNLDLLEDLRKPDEAFSLTKNAFYLHAPSGIGRSKLAAKVDTALGVQTTARNWRSVLAIKALAEAATPN